MGYKIKFTHPDFDKDVEFDLTGVGLIKNGGTVSLNADEERDFIGRVGQRPSEYFKGNDMVEITGASELKKEEVDAILPPSEEEAAAATTTVAATPTVAEGGDNT
jgi:hypothetical protein